MTVTLNFAFFFNDTATTEIYTLSLHDALPICSGVNSAPVSCATFVQYSSTDMPADRKSTRLNSSHSQISYAVFCLKKKRSTWDKPVLARSISMELGIYHEFPVLPAHTQAERFA